MKIKYRLALLTAFFTFMFIFVVLLVRNANNNITSSMKASETISVIQMNIHNLDNITNEFILYREERMLAQWHISYDSALELLEAPDDSLYSTAEIETVASLHGNLLSIKDIFSRLTGIINMEALPSKETSGNRQYLISSLEARLISHLTLASQEANRNSLLLMNMNHDSIKAAHRKVDIAFMVSLLFFTVFLGTTIYIIYRRIASPLLRLAESTKIIGSGNIDHKIQPEGRDEIGELAESFDNMRLKLKDYQGVLQDKVAGKTEELAQSLENAKKQNVDMSDAQSAMLNLVEDLEDSKSKMEIEMEERRKADEEVRRLNEELEERVRSRTAQLEAANSELESFAYSVSHDLRSPLRGIDGFSHALLEEYDSKLDDTGRDYLQRVRKATKKMAQLIDDLLMLSRISRRGMSVHDTDLSVLANEVLNDIKAGEPDRNVEIVLQEGMHAECDKDLMRIALVNLIGNAWKFTGRNSKVKIEIGSTSKNGKSAFYVKDNGVGFNMAYVDKLFVPFQRLHGADEFQGTGIGLATVKRIIVRHGGDVWAEAEEGKGATFYFTIG